MLATIASTLAKDDILGYFKHEFDDLFNIEDDLANGFADGVAAPHDRTIIRKKHYKTDDSLWQCDTIDDDICVISNKNLTATTDKTVNNISNITRKVLNVSLQNVTFTCYTENCTFNLKVVESNYTTININRSSTIQFPVINIVTSGSLTLSGDSQLIASGMSNSQRGSYKIDKDIQGAAHAGQGGDCSGHYHDYTYGDHYKAIDLSTESDKTQFMGSTGGVNKSFDQSSVNGGGIIVLECQVFSLSGNVEASGFPYNASTYDGDVDQDQISGGSGGYILIQQYNQNATNLPSTFIGPINANGGWSNNKGAGGSGGRIVINVNQDVENSIQSNQYLLTTYGGINKNPNQYCLNGAAGTIYLKNSSKLYISGNEQTNPIVMKTPIKNTVANDLKELTISGNAIVSLVNTTGYTPMLNATRIVIKDGGQIKEPISNSSTNSFDTMEIECDYLEVSGKDSTIQWDIQVNNTHFRCKSINITSQANLNLKSSINTTIFNVTQLKMQTGAQMNVGQYFQMQGSDLEICNLQQQLPSQASEKTGDIDNTNTHAQIVADQGNHSKIWVVDASCIIKSDYLTMISLNKINISGTIQPLSDQFSKCELNGTNFFSFVNQSEENYLPLTSELFIKNYNQNKNHQSQQIERLNQTNLNRSSNFTQTFISFGGFHTSTTANIKGPRIAIFGNQITHWGTLDSSGYGCPSGEGRGKGFFSLTSQCGGQGASHAGNGGMPWNISTTTDYEACRKVIKNQTTGLAYGYTAMGPVFEGSGGGNPVQGGKGGGVVWIQSETINIEGGILSQGTDSANSTQGGGGSGGTIVISTNRLDSGPLGKLSVKGGSSQNSVGGAGSGGRVKLFRFNWKDTANYEAQGQQIITVDRDGGDTNSTVKDGRQGSMWSTPCPLGYAGFTCQMCGNGTYSNDYYDNLCNPCTNMPADTQRAHYKQPDGIPHQNNSDCPYECVKDQNLAPVATNPYCLHNFDLFLQNIGGWQIFVLLNVSLVLLVIFVLYFLFKQKKTHRIDKLIKMGEDVIMDPDFNGGRQSTSKRVRIKDEQTITTALVENNLKFFDRDIYMHFGRIYLLGSNHRYHQFQIPQQPPVQIRSKINNMEYKEFIEDMNSQIKTKYSSCTHYLISLFYPALFPHYIYRKRIKSCYKLIKKFDDKFQEANFWKNEEERMRGHIQTKLSFSSNMSLCYLDFLDTRLTPDTFEGPQFPQTFVLGGEGVFHNPYELDYKTDPIIKSIGMISSDQKKWKKFLKNLNSKVATIMPLSFIWMLKKSLFDVLKYIQMSNNQLFANDGFKISMWIIEIQDGKTENYYKLDLDYIQKKQNQFDNFLTHWSRKTLFCTKTEFKIAMVLQSDKNDLRESHKTQAMVTNRDRSFEVESKRGSSPAPPMRVVTQSLLGTNLDNYENQSDNSKVSRLTTPRGGIVNRKTGNTLYNQVDNIQFITANMREPHIDQFWLKQFKQRKSSFFQDFSCFIISLIQALSLRHVVTNINIVLVIILNMILIFTDAIFTGITIQMLVQLAEQKPFGMSSWFASVLFLGICPFASIISPMLGIVSMMLCKARYYQNLAYFNTLTLFCNCVLLLIYLLVDNSISSFYGISMTIYLIAVKILLAQIIPQLIAFFKNTKYAKNNDYLGLIPDFSDQSKQDAQEQDVIKVENVEQSILTNDISNKFKYQEQDQFYLQSIHDKNADQAQNQNNSLKIPSSQRHKLEAQLHDSDFDDFNQTEDVPMYQRDAFSVEEDLM